MTRGRVVYLGQVLREICGEAGVAVSEGSFTVEFDETESEDLVDWRLKFFQSEREAGSA
jgi:hypothetical protein